MFKRTSKNRTKNRLSFSSLAHTNITQQATYNELNYQRIKQVCNSLGLNSIIILNWLRYKKFTGIPAELSPQEMDELVLWLVSQWSSQQGMNQVDRAAKSYLKYVTPLIDRGCGEVEVLNLWVQLVQLTSKIIAE